MKNGAHWPRGKMLGGCHGTNSMIYVRGNDRDFDRWSEAGNPGWSFDEVLPYFKKTEGMQIPEIANAKGGKFHSTEGPMKIDRYHSSDPMREYLLAAGRELGYKVLPDINADEFIGLTVIQGTLDGNRRCSTAKALLVPARDRPNLHIIKHAHVTKVLIDDSRRAIGVDFIRHNVKFTARANKEVILSAGAVNTPQILMLSGVGPKDHLEQHSIETIVDLAVGKNLQDHPYVGLPLVLKNAEFKNEDFMTTFLKYVKNEYGQPGNGLFDIVGFFNTVNATDKYPDLQTHYVHMGKESNFLLPRYMRETLGFNDAVVQSVVDANQKYNYFLALSILLNPKSKGEILLRSADPFDPPLINANYFDDEEDLKTLVRGVRLSQKFMQTKSFRELGAAEIQLNIPECKSIHDKSSDQFYECIVRHIVSTLYHPTGTAKMGPNSDPTAVVDARLRVKGIRGLRVADASIMPDITSGNTNAPVIMIGEKAADLIKSDWSIQTN